MPLTIDASIIPNTTVTKVVYADLDEEKLGLMGSAALVDTEFSISFGFYKTELTKDAFGTLTEVITNDLARFGYCLKGNSFTPTMLVWLAYDKVKEYVEYGTDSDIQFLDDQEAGLKQTGLSALGLGMTLLISQGTTKVDVFPALFKRRFAEGNDEMIDSFKDDQAIFNWALLAPLFQVMIPKLPRIIKNRLLLQTAGHKIAKLVHTYSGGNGQGTRAEAARKLIAEHKGRFTSTDVYMALLPFNRMQAQGYQKIMFAAIVASYTDQEFHKIYKQIGLSLFGKNQVTSIDDKIAESQLVTEQDMDRLRGVLLTISNTTWGDMSA